MELPKNITQIGQSNKDCKIYVEDYVISYLKQWNRVASNKDIAIALYGTRKEENQVSYLFLYGACKLDFLQRETRHLSQAQQQEVDKLRNRYFPEYSFLGYRILNGEMIEGFHVGNQGSYRYIEGYAQFYEKNDSMLAYMLDTRTEQAQPEVVEQDKYEEVKRRQEERKAQAEPHKPFGSYAESVEEPERKSVQRTQKKVQTPPKAASSSPGMRRLQLSVVAVFALLCLAGLSTLDGEDNDLAVAARQVIEGLTEQKLPDADQLSNTDAEVDTLITEDKLVAAVQEENQSTSSEQTGTSPDMSQTQTQSGESSAQTVEPSQAAGSTESGAEAESGAAATESTGAADAAQTGSQGSGEKTETQSDGNTSLEQSGIQGDGIALGPSTSEARDSGPDNSQAAAQTGGQAPVAYIIQKGDTLISICNRQYGTDGRVDEVCALNRISDPDDIKIGQILLLP